MTNENRQEQDSTQRFSNRADLYVRYRPSYPRAAIDFLYQSVGFDRSSSIADIGAGTGILTRLLVDRGSRVRAIEPNEAMREYLEDAMGSTAFCDVIEGTAESTGLPSGSVDFVICAQSFHWFNRDATRQEFQRILKKNGKVVLMWNSRLTEGSAFLEGYEQLLQTYGTDYDAVNHTNISADAFRSFFKEDTMMEAQFPMKQLFDYEGLEGRLKSSSYTPLPGHTSYEPMIQSLHSLFEQTKEAGVVSFDYVTQLFVGEV